MRFPDCVSCKEPADPLALCEKCHAPICDRCATRDNERCNPCGLDIDDSPQTEDEKMKATSSEPSRRSNRSN